MLERTPISGRGGAASGISWRWRRLPSSSCARSFPRARPGVRRRPMTRRPTRTRWTTSRTVLGRAGWWDAGYTGKGVDVAADRHGRVAGRGPEHAGQGRLRPRSLARVAVAGLRNLDTNGHGTFMAGLIAGHDSTVTAPYSAAPASAYRGIAPDARIVSLKVATADGGADVTPGDRGDRLGRPARPRPRLQHPRHQPLVRHELDAGLRVDPLAYAAEQAWKKGIVVVAAAGNTGYQRGNGAPGLADPAYDPYVIGGRRLRLRWERQRQRRQGRRLLGELGRLRRACKNPDFVARGSHLQGLRVPGRYLDQTHPEGSDRQPLLPRLAALRRRRRSRPASSRSSCRSTRTLTPDQVKRFITANGEAGSASRHPGAGRRRDRHRRSWP